MILFTISAAAFSYAARAAHAKRPWCAAAAASVVLGLAGVVVQGFEYANLGFTPSDGGYASVFMGWTIMFAVLVLPAMFWVETLLANGVRNRGSSGHLPVGMDAAAFYWSLLAGIGILTWFVLYVL